MFETNIAKKIKSLAKVIYGLGIAGSIISAIIMFVLSSEYWRNEELFIVLGVVFLIVGWVSAWIVSTLIAGFGDIIEKLNKIEQNTCGGKHSKSAQMHEHGESSDDRTRKLMQLRAQGLISEEEYQQALRRER